MDNERFSHHEPCPRCGSRDNLGVWVDGHKFCFGCGYREAAPTTIANLLRRTKMENKNNNATLNFDLSSCTSKIPDKPLEWLKKYGITDQEIDYYGLLYDTDRESLIFPFRDDSGIYLVQERYFGNLKNKPKYITTGPKGKPFIIINKHTAQTIVFVEDFVSAIKVGRQCSSSPLLGCTIPANTVKWASERFKRVRVWLDMNKAVESLQEASRLSQFIKDTTSIITPLDPKEYSNDEITKILKDSGVLTSR